MARYYFDTHDGRHLATDEEGQELDASTFVRREALNALADMAHDNFRKDHLDHLFVSVRSEDGQIVFRATVSLTVEEDRTQPA